MSLVSLIGFPLSMVSKTDRKRECFWINLAKAYRYFARVSDEVFDQEIYAFFAAPTAALTSALLEIHSVRFIKFITDVWKTYKHNF